MNKKKQKNNSVPPEMITSSRFKEIAKILGEKDNLSNKDRYLLGYSLLRSNKALDALTILWPLAIKKRGVLEQDCLIIARSFFKIEGELCALSLTDDQLLTLFYIAREAHPNTNPYYLLKKRLFSLLWSSRHYDKLERMIKSSKNKYSSSLVENLGKLQYFQAEKKLIENPRGFVSYILTGGACLILRNPLYRECMEHAIRLLALMIKSTYTSLNDRKKSSCLFDAVMFESFVDYESEILIHALEVAIKHNLDKIEVVPTPSYLMIYDPSGTKVGTSFLSWLVSKDKSLAEIYEPVTYRTAFWAMTGKELLSGNGDVLSLCRSHFKNKPHLKLAIMLRAMDCLSAPFKDIVKPNEFKKSKSRNALYKNIAIKTAQTLAATQGNHESKKELYHLLLSFYDYIGNDNLANLLVSALVRDLQRARHENRSLDISMLKSLSYKIGNLDLKKMVDTIHGRQERCKKLIKSLENKNALKKTIKSINTRAELQRHITLIADACCLTYGDLSATMYHHVKDLVNNNKINKIIPLQESIKVKLSCDCRDCRKRLYRSIIPMMCTKMKLATVVIPTPGENILKNSTENECNNILKMYSVINTKVDPFKTLGVSITASKKAVMQKVMALIGDRPDEMALLRNAQQVLFNPITRFISHYLHGLINEESIDNNEPVVTSDNLEDTLHNIKFRKEYC